MNLSIRFLIAALACSVAGYSQVRISQVYGGGQAGASTYANDYVELFNAGPSPVNLAGYAIQYQAPTTVTGNWSGNLTITSGTIQPGRYFLVQVSSNSGSGSGALALPTPDFVSTAISMGGSNGKVALTSNNTPLVTSAGPPIACPTGGSVVDLVGYGTANCGEGTPMAATSATTAGFRAGAGCTDTNNNSSDFSTAAPVPRNSSSPTNSCGGSTPPTATGTATSVIPGGTSTLSGTITAGANPASASYTVACNLTAVGGSATFNLPVTGTAFTSTYSVPGATAPAVYSLPCTVTDNVPRNSNFNISLTVSSSTPTLTINDVSANETNSGTTNFTFTVSLSAPAPTGGVSFTIGTADNTATAPSDYTSQTLTAQTIPQGSSTYSFVVSVLGDTSIEPTEIFLVNVTNVTGANVGDGQGQGTIVNDDVAPPTLTPISSVQGTGATSPLVGQTVTVAGVVTALTSNGYFLQTPDNAVDSNPNTSEGIFVFTNAAPTVAVGNAVNSTGQVIEFKPSVDPNSPGITEISQTSQTIGLISNSLPAPVVLPALTTNGGLEQYERFEGMRVQAASLTVAAPTDGNVAEASATATSTGVLYTVFPGVAIPFREAGIESLDLASFNCAAGSGCALPVFDTNPERLRLDTDAVTGQAAVNVNTGATLSNVVGVMHYGFRAYTVLTTAAPVLGGTPVTATAASVAPAGVVTVAAMNVERLYDTINDPNGDTVVTQTAFDGRLNKMSLAIRNLLRTPDVIAFSEVEKLSVLQALADKINADAVAASQPNPMYQAQLVEGNDVGGIDVGFLIKSTVSVVSVTQLGSALTFTNPCDGTSDLLNDRPTLRLRGTSGGTAFAVFVNHLRSLNGIDDLAACSGNGFSSTAGGRVRAKRAAQANYVAGLVQDEVTANPSAKIVLVGDFNAFEVNDGFVDVINTIMGTPPTATQVVTTTFDPTYPNMTNMLSLMPTAQRYSYVFDGNHQTLDHAILNPAAMSQFVGGGYVRVNADFNEAGFRGNFNTPERYSDHDPVYVRLSTGTNVTPQLAVTRTILAFNRGTGLYQSTVTVTNNTANTISGPLQLAVTGVTDKATLMNAASSTPAGGIYTNLPASLAPGQSASVLLTFSLPASMPVNFTANVFAAPALN